MFCGEVKETSIFLINVLTYGKLDFKNVFRISFTPSLPQEILEGTSVSYLCKTTFTFCVFVDSGWVAATYSTSSG